MTRSARRTVNRRASNVFGFGLKAGASVSLGAIVALENGWLVEGKATPGMTVVGMAAHSADNSSGADGDEFAQIERGAFLLNNSLAADLITAADIGLDCYLVDARTVAKTNGGGARSRAGLILDLTGGNVWVQIDGRR